MTACDAWGYVMKSVRDFGYMRETDALAYMGVRIADIVRAIGWQRICTAMPMQLQQDREWFCMMWEKERGV